MPPHSFRSWWRGEGGSSTEATTATVSTNDSGASITPELEHKPLLVQQTKTLSWYGSISLTPVTSSASSSLTSSPHDRNQLAKALALANNKIKQNKETELPLTSNSTMNSTKADETRQPLLGLPNDDGGPPTDDPLHPHPLSNGIHDSAKKHGLPSLCWGAVANLCAATLGAGLLALPFAFAKAGWIGGLILLTGSAMATQYSITMIVMAAGAAKVAAVKARAAGETVSYRSDSYESLVEFLLGRRWRRLVEVCLVVFCFGCIIGYTITVGDLLEAAHLVQGDYRVASMVSVWFVAMFPLSLLRRMQSLQWASAVGIASIGTLVVATLVNLIEDATSVPDHGSNHTNTNTTVVVASVMWKLSKSGTGQKVDVAANFLQCLWPKDWISFVRALPLILFAFSCQVNVCAIYDELPTQSDSTTPQATTAEATSDAIYHDPEPTLHHCVSQKVQEEQVAMFRRVSGAAVAICAFLYASIAIIGVANFGQHLLPNILSNYQVPIKAMMQVAFAATACAVIMAFPLNVFPVRITLRGLLCTSRSNNDTNGSNGSLVEVVATVVRDNDLGQPLLLQHEHETPKLSLDHSETPEWLEEARAGAAVVKDESEVLALPVHETMERDQSFGAHFLLTLAIAGSALGIALVLPNISVVFGLLGGSTTSILGFVIPGFLGLAALDSKNDEHEGNGSPTLSIRRWQCWVLVIGGAIIGIITTSVTIYSYTS